MTDISISIIIPYFFDNRFIQDALNSVQELETVSIEIILIDDSADETESIFLRKIIEKNSKIPIVLITNQKNLGLTKSLNRAVKQAKGELIMRLDSDDFNIKGRIEKSWEYYQKGYDFIGVSSILFSSDGRIFNSFPSKKLEGDKIRQSIIAFKPTCSHSGFCFSKKLFHMIDGYDEYFVYSQDKDFLLRALKKPIKAIILPEVLIKVRLHPFSLSESEKRAEQTSYGLVAIVRSLLTDEFSSIKLDTIKNIIERDPIWRSIVIAEMAKRDYRSLPRWRLMLLAKTPAGIMVILKILLLNTNLKKISIKTKSYLEKTFNLSIE